MTSRVSAPPPHRVDLPVPQPNPALAPLARRAHSALLVGVLAVATAPVCAQNWTWGSAVTARETVTNNVKLQSDTRQSDWVTELTPSLHVNEKGARTTFAGTLSVPIVFYARNGGNNTAYPSADLLGDVRLIGEIFHVEGQASVAQGVLPGDRVPRTRAHHEQGRADPRRGRERPPVALPRGHPPVGDDGPRPA